MGDPLNISIIGKANNISEYLLDTRRVGFFKGWIKKENRDKVDLEMLRLQKFTTRYASFSSHKIINSRNLEKQKQLFLEALCEVYLYYKLLRSSVGWLIGRLVNFFL